MLDAQNLSQLKGDLSADARGNYYRDLILSNTVNKFIFGNATPEDVKWWETAMQDKREWTFNNTYNTDKVEYDPKKGNIEFKWKPNYAAGKIMALKDKQVIYKIKDLKGKSIVEKGKVDFIESRYKEVQKSKIYDFSKFTNGISDDANSSLRKALNKKKADFSAMTTSNDNYDIEREVNPIKTDTSDSKYLFDNEDAIVVNFKNPKNEN